ncbi:MAG: SEC-C metal-binding domain-containing protein [Candidatus Eisenbacteria bacterium]
MGFTDLLARVLGGKRKKSGPQVQRNDPCWCGSGKKYKRCHYDSDQKRGVSRGGKKST